MVETTKELEFDINEIIGNIPIISTFIVTEKSTNKSKEYKMSKWATVPPAIKKTLQDFIYIEYVYPRLEQINYFDKINNFIEDTGKRVYLDVKYNNKKRFEVEVKRGARRENILGVDDLYIINDPNLENIMSGEIEVDEEFENIKDAAEDLEPKTKTSSKSTLSKQLFPSENSNTQLEKIDKIDTLKDALKKDTSLIPIALQEISKRRLLDPNNGGITGNEFETYKSLIKNAMSSIPGLEGQRKIVGEVKTQTYVKRVKNFIK